ncbi:hypothetical protein VTO42DRAFT_7932 [Malbranchea cinnamomea]
MLIILMVEQSLLDADAELQAVNTGESVSRPLSESRLAPRDPRPPCHLHSPRRLHGDALHRPTAQDVPSWILWRGKNHQILKSLRQLMMRPSATSRSVVSLPVSERSRFDASSIATDNQGSSSRYAANFVDYAPAGVRLLSVVSSLRIGETVAAVLQTLGRHRIPPSTAVSGPVRVPGIFWVKEVFDKHTRHRTKGQYRLLIMDSHGGHATPEFDSFCMENQIVLF